MEDNMFARSLKVEISLGKRVIVKKNQCGMHWLVKL